jgi:hypothetical protein
LETKGLVTIVSRQGVLVNDYRITGKLELLEHLYDLDRKGIHPKLNQSMCRFIKANFQTLLVELASKNCNLKSCITPKSDRVPLTSGEEIFKWMHDYAMCSENVIYTMLFNEFKVGIFNVGDAVVKADADCIELGRMSIDHAVDSGHVDVIEGLLEQWFKTIEKLWLGGEEE